MLIQPTEEGIVMTVNDLVAEAEARQLPIEIVGSFLDREGQQPLSLGGQTLRADYNHQTMSIHHLPALSRHGS
jgi:hypothetical protein